MTVQEFLQNYGGNECVSIEGYCEEKHYDYCSGGRNKNPPALAVGSVNSEKQTSGSCLMITQITTNRPV